MEDLEKENELYERIHNLEMEKYELEDENEELKLEIEQLKQDLLHLRQDIEDNYKRIPISEQVDVYNKDFI